MTYQTLSSKTAGVDDIDSADLADIETNLAHFLLRPALRIVQDFAAGGQFSDGAFSSVEYDIASNGTEEWHEEWLDPEPSTDWFPNAGGDGTETNDSRIHVGDVATGFWFVGGSFRVEKDSGGNKREGRIYRNGSTQLAGAHQLPSADHAANFHLSAVFDFTTNGYFELQAWQDSGGVLDAPYNYRPPMWWALYLGTNSNWGVGYSGNRATSTSQPVGWWNQMRINMERLNARPTARIRESNGQTISTGTWTRVLFDTLSDENDSDLVTSPAYPIRIQETGYYLVQYGLEYASFDTASTDGALARVYVDGVDQGADTQANSTYVNSASANDDVQLSNSLLMYLEAGEDVDVYTWQNSGSNKDLTGSTGCFLSVSLLAFSRTALDSDRQDFSHTGLPDTLPEYASTSGGKFTLGLANAYSDILDFIACPFLLKLKLKKADGAYSPHAQWFRQPLTNVVLDPHSYADDDAIAQGVITSDGGIKVPYGGLYMVIAHVTFDEEDAEGDNNQDDGRRGIRITLNGEHVAVCRDTRGSSSGASWGMGIAEPHVAQAGDVFHVETWANNETDGTAQIVEVVDLSVVWVGRGLTRTRN